VRTSSNSAARSVALLLESDGPGGAEYMVLRLALELRERGYRVCPIGPAAGCGWLANRFREEGFAPRTFRLRRPLDPACVYDIVSAVRGERIHTLHSHEFTMAVYGALAARVLRRRHIITMHGGTYFAQRLQRRKALRWAIRDSGRSVAVSSATGLHLEQSLQLPRGSVRVVYNGVPVQAGEGSWIKRELGIAPGAGELLILAVGNLYPVKGHAVLARALAQLHAEAPQVAWRVALAGRGEEEGRIRAIAEEGGYADRLHVLGYREDVGNLLAAADLFVMPSLSEGLPLALLEAMLARKPIVATSVGGVPEAITTGASGVLVPPGDSTALAAALLRLLGNAALRDLLGRAAGMEAERRFSLAAMTDSYEAVYAGR
jgi:glycosyltransferase involved in cell wall biosynthesis